MARDYQPIRRHSTRLSQAHDDLEATGALEAEAAGAHLASDDYPEMGDILRDRPDPGSVITVVGAQRTIAPRGAGTTYGRPDDARDDEYNGGSQDTGIYWAEPAQQEWKEEHLGPQEAAPPPPWAPAMLEAGMPPAMARLAQIEEACHLFGARQGGAVHRATTINGTQIDDHGDAPEHGTVPRASAPDSYDERSTEGDGDPKWSDPIDKKDTEDFNGATVAMYPEGMSAGGGPGLEIGAYVAGRVPWTSAERGTLHRWQAAPTGTWGDFVPSGEFLGRDAHQSEEARQEREDERARELRAEGAWEPWGEPGEFPARQLKKFPHEDSGWGGVIDRIWEPAADYRGLRDLRTGEDEGPGLDSEFGGSPYPGQHQRAPGGWYNHTLSRLAAFGPDPAEEANMRDHLLRHHGWTAESADRAQARGDRFTHMHDTLHQMGMANHAHQDPAEAARQRELSDRFGDPYQAHPGSGHPGQGGTRFADPGEALMNSQPRDFANLRTNMPFHTWSMRMTGALDPPHPHDDDSSSLDSGPSEGDEGFPELHDDLQSPDEWPLAGTGGGGGPAYTQGAQDGHAGRVFPPPAAPAPAAGADGVPGEEGDPGDDGKGKKIQIEVKAHLAAFTTAAADPRFRFEFTAAWSDVVAKARRIRAEGHVRITHASTGLVIGEVRGDHDTYESGIQRPPGKPQTIQHWACGCPWASFHQDKSLGTRYAGRPCSHVMALQYEAQARGMFGKSVYRDEQAPAWSRKDVVVKSWPPYEGEPHAGHWADYWLAPSAARTAAYVAPGGDDDWVRGHLEHHHMVDPMALANSGAPDLARFHDLDHANGWTQGHQHAAPEGLPAESRWPAMFRPEDGFGMDPYGGQRGYLPAETGELGRLPRSLSSMGPATAATPDWYSRDERSQSTMERSLEEHWRRQRTGRGWETELIPNRNFVGSPSAAEGGVTHLMRAYLNGQPVGTIGVGASNNMKAWRVYNVHVRPEFHGQEAAGSMMDSFYDHARGLGAEWVDHGRKTGGEESLPHDYSEPHPEMNIHNSRPDSGWNKYFHAPRVYKDMTANHSAFPSSSPSPSWKSVNEYSDPLNVQVHNRWTKARGLPVQPHAGEWPEGPVNDVPLRGPGHQQSRQRESWRGRQELVREPEPEPGSDRYNFGVTLGGLRQAASLVPFDRLQPHEQASVAQYHQQMIEEGNAGQGSTPRDYLYDSRQEPRDEFLSRYMDADDEFKREYPNGPADWEAHHQDTVARHPIPSYPEAGRWPLIVRDENPNYVDDGYHRMHSYIRDGATHLPTVRMYRAATPDEARDWDWTPEERDAWDSQAGSHDDPQEGSQGSCYYRHEGPCPDPGMDRTAESLRHPRPGDFRSEIVPNPKFDPGSYRGDDSSTHVMNGYLGRRLAGRLHFSVSDDGAAYHVGMLHTRDAPGIRGKGVASALMDDLYSHAKGNGAWLSHGQRTSAGNGWWASYREPHPDVNIHHAHPDEGWKDYFSPHEVAEDAAFNYAESGGRGMHTPLSWRPSDYPDRVPEEKWTHYLGLRPPGQQATAALLAAGEDLAELIALAQLGGFSALVRTADQANAPWGSENVSKHPPVKPYGATEPLNRDQSPASYGFLSAPDPDNWGGIQDDIAQQMPLSSSASLLPHLAYRDIGDWAPEDQESFGYADRDNAAGPSTSLTPRDPGGIRMEEACRACPCCAGTGEHDTGRECYGCDASGSAAGYSGSVPCDGVKPYGTDSQGHQVELDPLDGWQHLDGSVSHDDDSVVTDDPVIPDGEAARAGLGIDGTAGDAQDVPHPFAGDSASACQACGLGHEAGTHRKAASGTPFAYHGEIPQLDGALAELHDDPEPALPSTTGDDIEATAAADGTIGGGDAGSGTEDQSPAAMAGLGEFGASPAASGVVRRRPGSSAGQRRTTGGSSMGDLARETFPQAQQPSPVTQEPGMGSMDEPLSPDNPSIQTIGNQQWSGGGADSGEVTVPAGEPQGSIDDIVAAFQRSAAARQFGAPAGGRGGTMGDGDIASAAREYLSKTADVLPDAEAAELIAEGRGQRARNLGMLRLEGTHYEDEDEDLARRGVSLDDYDDDVISV